VGEISGARVRKRKNGWGHHREPFRLKSVDIFWIWEVFGRLISF